MNSARLSTSARLRRVDALLLDGRERSTLDIIQQAGVCAVNSVVAELRANGRTVHCRREGDVWFYRMDPPPPVVFHAQPLFGGAA